jgi:hypothetical protein
VFFASNRAKDIALVCNQGYDVHDDNKPAPENVPDTATPLSLDNEGLFEGQHWGVNHNVDPMELHGSMKTHSFMEFDLTRSVSLSILLKLFTWKWRGLILLVKTNKNLEQEVRWGELLRYLGLWFLMASVEEDTRRKIFGVPNHLLREQIPAPTTYNFSKYMSAKRFDAIIAALCFTDVNKPTYRDKFWEVRQMIAEWNKNMVDAFSPGGLFVWMS